jgi:hypothetical protein
MTTEMPTLMTTQIKKIQIQQGLDNNPDDYKLRMTTHMITTDNPDENPDYNP